MRDRDYGIKCAIGDKLRNERLRQNVGIKPLAIMADVGETTIANLENPSWAALPNLSSLLAVVHSLGVTMEWLFEGIKI